MWLTNVDVDWPSQLGSGGEGFVVLGKWNDETVAVRSLWALDNESVENERIKVGALAALRIFHALFNLFPHKSAHIPRSHHALAAPPPKYHSPSWRLPDKRW